MPAHDREAPLRTETGSHKGDSLVAERLPQIVSLDRKTAKDVMRPRSRMAAVSDDLSVEEMIADCFPLAEAPQAFARAAERGVLKVLLE